MTMTLEDNYVYSDADMGTSHIEAHKKQHNYMQDDEPEIIILNNNSALNVALNNGVKSESEWTEYNKGLRKGRQKKNYDEYLRGLSANLVKNKKRYVETEHKVPLSKSKKQMTYQEINSIEKNKFGVTGNLFYLSNVDDYEKQTDLKTYRKFEKDTFETFYKSDTFKKLHPENFKSEIHLDEKGAMHLQSGDVWIYKDSKGRASSARRKIIKDLLMNDLGSEDNLNKQLDVLSDCHKYVKDNTQKKEGTLRADAFFSEILKQNNNDLSQVNCPKARASERSVRTEELWRLKNMWALKEIAKEKSKQYGVNYDIKDSTIYKTDGVHRSASEYEMQQSVKKKSKDLDTQKEEVAEKERRAQELMNKAMEEHNKALALQAKVLAREQKIKDGKKDFESNLLTLVAPRLSTEKRNELLDDGSAMFTMKDKTQRVMSLYEYAGLKIAGLKKLRQNNDVHSVDRKSADETLANVQKNIVDYGQTNQQIDWNKRFGIDPSKLAKPVNKVKKQDSHKKVQQDDLEL